MQGERLDVVERKRGDDRVTRAWGRKGWKEGLGRVGRCSEGAVQGQVMGAPLSRRGCQHPHGHDSTPQEEARKAQIAAAVARGEMSPDVLAEELEEMPDTERVRCEPIGDMREGVRGLENGREVACCEGGFLVGKGYQPAWPGAVLGGVHPPGEGV